MRGRSPGVLVCLHDIELRAVFSSDVVGIAVVVPIGIVGSTVRANGWQSHSVEGSNAAALHLAEIDIVLD